MLIRLLLYSDLNQNLLNNRDVDTELFEKIGQHVDWLAFYKNAQPKNQTDGTGVGNFRKVST